MKLGEKQLPHPDLVALGRGVDPVAAVELGALEVEAVAAADQRRSARVPTDPLLDPPAEQPGDEALGLGHVRDGDGEVRVSLGLAPSASVVVSSRVISAICAST